MGWKFAFLTFHNHGHIQQNFLWRFSLQLLSWDTTMSLLPFQRFRTYNGNYHSCQIPDNMKSTNRFELYEIEDLTSNPGKSNETDMIALCTCILWLCVSATTISSSLPPRQKPWGALNWPRPWPSCPNLHRICIWLPSELLRSIVVDGGIILLFAELA